MILKEWRRAKKYFTDFRNITYCKDAYETTKDSNALVILTEWNQFRALDLEKIKNTLKNKIIIDLRNIYNPKELNEMGFKYYSVGRKILIEKTHSFENNHQSL